MKEQHVNTHTFKTNTVIYSHELCPGLSELCLSLAIQTNDQIRKQPVLKRSLQCLFCMSSESPANERGYTLKRAVCHFAPCLWAWTKHKTALCHCKVRNCRKIKCVIWAETNTSNDLILWKVALKIRIKLSSIGTELSMYCIYLGAGCWCCQLQWLSTVTLLRKAHLVTWRQPE